MSELEVDAGNTFIKWRRKVSGKYMPAISSDFGDFEVALSNEETSRALIACVAGQEMEQKIAGLLVKNGIENVFWAKAGKKAVGVTNGYGEYQKLGVDRWLACLAAYKMTGGSVCVVDFGSAITMDVIDDNGCHKGGYIAPGARLCFMSLGGNTGSLAGEYEYTSSDKLGLSTKNCIENGVYLMQAGFLAEVLKRFGGGSVICTGGGYRQFMGFLSERDVVYCQDLVLDGLRLAYEDSCAGLKRGE